MKARLSLFAVVVVTMATGAALCQPPTPYGGYGRRPSYSPYLNLTRPGGGPAQNYYGLVRPEFEFRNDVFQLRRDAQSIASSLAAPQPSQELATGHATGYMTHLRYFGTNGVPGAARPSTRSAASPTAAGATIAPRQIRGR